MINKWILNNFKSIDAREELEFRPLTIFTGANSSGKSTVLQSILLISQTLQSPIESRSIVLNGGIKKFGSYGDIVHRRLWKKDLTIGFDITNDKYAGSRFYTPWEEGVKGVLCQFAVGAKKEEDLQPYLKKLQIIARGDGDKEAMLALTRNENPTEKVKKLVETMKNIPDSEDLNYSVNVKIEDGFSHYRYGRDAFQNVIGASLTHFLPQYLLSPYNVYEAIGETFMDRFYSSSYRFYNILDFETMRFLSDELKDTYFEIANKLEEYADLHPRLKKRKMFEQSLAVYRGMPNFMNFVELYRNCEMPLGEKAPFAERLKSALAQIPPRYNFERISTHAIPGVDYMRQFFCNHIWYLGPLREEPKAVYPLESDIAMNEVGYKGENTAAVYEYKKNTKIKYIAPSAFSDINNVIFKETEVTLEKAIREWLIYLGVASDIATDDKGKIGHSMQISNDLKIKQDLTHVGVGVSQVLPILVMSLLAVEGDVIILEQPELHLHPKVQTRLADFFVSMNALHKQCLVETHSEYLVNRLRYLVASSKDTTVADNTMLYFVEKEKAHSIYRPITINKYGVIEDWPDGFFDESEKTSMEILRAGMAKKALEDGDNYEE